jgi:hypothetical protein
MQDRLVCRRKVDGKKQRISNVLTLRHDHWWVVLYETFYSLGDRDQQKAAERESRKIGRTSKENFEKVR